MLYPLSPVGFVLLQRRVIEALSPTCLAEGSSECSRTRAGEAVHLIDAFASIQARTGFTFVDV